MTDDALHAARHGVLCVQNAAQPLLCPNLTFTADKAMHGQSASRNLHLLFTSELLHGPHDLSDKLSQHAQLAHTATQHLSQCPAVPIP